MRDTIHMLHRLEHRVSMLQTLSTENEEKRGVRAMAMAMSGTGDWG